MRLGRLLVELMPDEPEARGLLALMLLDESRRPARVAADGSLVRLADQDRSLLGPRRSSPRGSRSSGECLRRNAPGPYQVQAAIAAVHSDAATAAATPTGAQMLALYDRLLALAPSHVVRLNRAIALAEVDGPRPPALAEVDALSLDGLPPAARDARRPAGAARARRRRGAAYDRAIARTGNAAEQRFLAAQRDALTPYGRDDAEMCDQRQPWGALVTHLGGGRDEVCDQRRVTRALVTHLGMGRVRPRRRRSRG